MNRSLEELEKVAKGNSHSRGSVATRGHLLQKKPLKNFSNEEILSMIVHNSNLKYLVPLAIERLQKDPLAKSEFYEGDLLNAVLTIEKKFWANDLNGYIPLLKEVIERTSEIIKTHPDEYKNYIQRSAHAIKLFLDNTATL